MSIRSLLYLITLAMAAGLHLRVAATGKPDASEPERIDTLDGGGSPTSGIAFSPRGDLLATGSEDQTAKLWDPATGQLRRTLIGNAGPVGDVAFSPDGRTLATGNAQGFVTIWDVASGRPHDWLPGVWGPLAFSPDGRFLAATTDNQVKLWDTRSWKLVRTLKGGRPPRSQGKSSNGISQLAFAPDGRSLATVESVFGQGEPGMPADFVQIWDTATWKVQRSLHEPPGSQIQVAFAPDSRFLAVAGGWIYRGNVLLWDIRTGKTRSLASVDDVDMVSSIIYDPRGRWVGFASQAGVRCVDVSSGKQFLAIKVGGHSFGNEQVLAISPDGRLLAAIREDGAVEVWRLPADLEAASGAAATAGSGSRS